MCMAAALCLHSTENLENFVLPLSSQDCITEEQSRTGYVLGGLTCTAVEKCSAEQGRANPGALEKFLSRTGSVQAD